jgi:hypothetical protein
VSRRPPSERRPKHWTRNEEKGAELRGGDALIGLVESLAVPPPAEGRTQAAA